jgi:hypothetical protein
MAAPLVTSPKARGPRVADLLAKIVTTLLQPNLLQVVVLLALVPGGPSLVDTLAIVWLAGLLPVVLYIVYLRANRVEISFELERKYRFVPLLINAGCMAVLLVLVLLGWLAGGAEDLRYVLSMLIPLNAVAYLVTMRVKLSLHLMGMTSGLLVLTYVPIASPFVPRTDAALVAIVVVVLAILAWARWQLRAHTIPEIALGTIMGFVATAAAAYGYQLLFL